MKIKHPTEDNYVLNYEPPYAQQNLLFVQVRTCRFEYYFGSFDSYWSESEPYCKKNRKKSSSFAR